MKYTFKALKMYISKATFQLKIGQTVPEKMIKYRKSHFWAHSAPYLSFLFTFNRP